MKRIAMIMPGGVTKRKDGVHIPSLYQFVEKLSELFEITVYSLVTFEPLATESTCGNAKVKILRAHYQEHWTKKLFQYTGAVYLDQKHNRYELLHGMYGLNAGLATVGLGKILGVPSVFSLLGGETVALPTIQYGALQNPVTKILTSLVCKNASLLTVQTNFQIQQLEKYLNIYRDDTRVLPRGVDTTMFYPDGRVNRLEPPYRLLHVANLHGVKDQATLLKAFALISQKIDCSLRVIGKDELNGKIQLLANDLGVAKQIEFINFLDYAKMPQHYRWAHLLLHTSLHETQAMVVAEAAACGTVVCGTRVGLIHDFEPESALAVAPGDFQGLAQIVINLLANKKLYTLLQKNALEWAQRYDINWTVKEYRTLYTQLTEKTSVK